MVLKIKYKLHENPWVKGIPHWNDLVNIELNPHIKTAALITSIVMTTVKPILHLLVT